MKLYKNILAVIACIGFNTTLACSVTLNPGNNVISSAVSAAATNAEICLNAGNYSESNTISLKSGQRVRGIAATRAGVQVYSQAATVIDAAPYSVVDKFVINGVLLPNYGVAASSDNNVLVWDMEIKSVKMPIMIDNSDYTQVAAVDINNSGNVSNASADPYIWINSSDYVELLYGTYTGRTNGPGGDGEVACYNSTNLYILGTNVMQSGAAGIYLVNCDNAVVENAVIHNGDEWGIDIVNGSNNFIGINNEIKWSYWGAVIFDETNNGTGTFNNNDFILNNISGSVSCQGIVVFGNTGNVSLSGNYANPNPVICPY
jgi:hypothetical protein